MSFQLPKTIVALDATTKNETKLSPIFRENEDGTHDERFEIDQKKAFQISEMLFKNPAKLNFLRGKSDEKSIVKTLTADEIEFAISSANRSRAKQILALENSEIDISAIDPRNLFADVYGGTIPRHKYAGEIKRHYMAMMHNESHDLSSVLKGKARQHVSLFARQHEI